MGIEDTQKGLSSFTAQNGSIRFLPENFTSATTKFFNLATAVDSALANFQRNAQLPGSAFPYKATGQPHQYQHECYDAMVTGLKNLHTTFENIATWLETVANNYSGTDTSIGQSFSRTRHPHG